MCIRHNKIIASQGAAVKPPPSFSKQSRAANNLVITICDELRDPRFQPIDAKEIVQLFEQKVISKQDSSAKPVTISQQDKKRLLDIVTGKLHDELDESFLSFSHFTIDFTQDFISSLLSLIGEEASKLSSSSSTSSSDSGSPGATRRSPTTTSSLPTITGVQPPSHLEEIPRQKLETINLTPVKVPFQFTLDGVPQSYECLCPGDPEKIKLNPYKHDVLQMIYSWGAEFGDFPTLCKDPTDAQQAEFDAVKSRILADLNSKKYIDLAINALPDICDKEKLLLNSIWIYVLFVFDSLLDNKDGFFRLPGNTTKSSEFITKLNRVLSEGSSGLEDIRQWISQQEWVSQKESAKVTKLVDAVYNLSGKISGSSKFQEEAQVYFRSGIDELQKKISNETDYWDLRDASGAVKSALALGASILGIHIEDIEHDHFFSNYLKAVVRLICLANDAVSGPGEWASPEENYFKVKTREHTSSGQSLKAAFERCVQHAHAFETAKWDTILSNRVRILADCRSGEILKPSVLTKLTDEKQKAAFLERLANNFCRYDQVCLDWIRSNLYFSIHTTIYRLLRPVEVIDQTTR